MASLFMASFFRLQLIGIETCLDFSHELDVFHHHLLEGDRIVAGREDRSGFGLWLRSFHKSSSSPMSIDHPVSSHTLHRLGVLFGALEAWREDYIGLVLLPVPCLISMPVDGYGVGQLVVSTHLSISFSSAIGIVFDSIGICSLKVDELEDFALHQ